MTTQDYTNLIESLKSIPRGNSESDNRNGMVAALEVIKLSDLPDTDKEQLSKTICQTANPSGWYFDSNGITGAIPALESIISATATQVLKTKDNQFESRKVPDKAPKRTFNRRNLNNLVSDGRIFSVEFIKRSTGELRTMTDRVGVKKHLQGGTKSYNPAQHNLLTVFDMDARGYRSIPIESVQRLSVGGQVFNFAGL